MLRKQMKLVLAILGVGLLCTACGADKESPSGGKNTPTPTEVIQEQGSTPTIPPTTPTPTTFEYNPSEERVENMDYSNEEYDKYAYVEEEEDVVYDEEFSFSAEAEDGVIEGAAYVDTKKAGHSGSGYVEVRGADTGDLVAHTVEIPASGFYRVTFTMASPYGEKENNILIDGEAVGIVACKKMTEEFETYTVENLFMAKGTHTVALSASWGWVQYDCMTVEGCEQPKKQEEEKTFAKAELSDAYASPNAQRLYQFLCDINGLYTLSGQYGDLGKNSNEFQAIYNATGRYPAVLGLDLMDYSPSRMANGSNSMAIQRASKYYRDGGIVTFSWHWNAPKQYLRPDKEWWRGFYTEAVQMDLDAIMSDEKSEGYAALLSDIDHIAGYLKQLADEDVPILFRPLHEASGGWFWWGDCKPETFQKLWIVLYERLTEYHGLHNLIWVFNGQAADWYPGDAYVDIIGEDLYPGERVYASQIGKYEEAKSYTDKKVPIALSENGCLFDPDLAIRDGARWAWFCTWSGEFVIDGAQLSEKYTEKTMVEKVYNHESILTLDELPDLTTYGD